jgi:signal transduction histidine kinase
MPPPSANAGELRARVAFGLWIALAGTVLFAIGDVIFAADALWVLYPIKALYLLAIAVVFRVLPRARDDAEVTRIALVAIGASFLVSSVSAVISRDPLTPAVLGSAVTLASAALVPWSVRAQCIVVALAALAVAGTSVAINGGAAALITYPTIVVVSTFGLSIYLSHLLGRYRAVAADAEGRLRAEARVSAALARVARELIAALDTGALLDRLAQLTVEVFACRASQTWMRDAEGVFRVAAGTSDDAEELEALRALSLPEAAVGALLDRLRREGVVTLDPNEIDALPTAGLSRRHQVGPVIFLPLRKGDEVVGVHTAVFRRTAPPPDAIVPQLAAGIAQLATLALETARLVEATNAADRLKTEFLANLSHELRTPLNVIIGYNEMLLDGSCGTLNGEQQAILDRTQHNARELLALMGAALELSRHDGRGLPLVLEPVSVALLVDDLAREVAALPEVSGVAFRWSVAPDLPPLLTDALKLRMILKNLIDNARKYTEHGHVALDAGPAAGGVELAVSDTGSGIPTEELGRIFEPFRQIGGGRAPGGVGLGLYLVRRLAEALGGRVDAESRPGEGSTFRVWLPLRAAPR